MVQVVDKIEQFSGEYRFLSNFYPSTIVYEDITYPTVEHAYQAAKTDDFTLKKIISLLPTAADAKKFGKSITLRKDWENIKFSVMLKLVTLKFQDEQLKKQLLATGNAQLIEGNWWGDRYWGVCRGEGQNQLGLILMTVRDSLK